MLVTVAICTWNRSALLDQTLARMRELVLPAGTTWELLVVNNNSTDDTDAVVEKHTAALPIHRLFEPKPGHSNARNCAIEAARGDLLVWTDDDVQVDPDWLVEYAKAAARFPEATYFGGTVDPWFSVEPPHWVLRNLTQLGGPFAIRQLGPEVRPFVGREQPYGANMAFRTAALRKHRFNPLIGRIGMGMMSGDETDVIERLRAAGGTGVWVGSAKVKHFLPAERMTTAYVWKFFHGLGRTEQRLKPLDPATPLLFGIPRWAIRKYVTARAESLLFSLGRGRHWIENFIAAATAKGQMDECRAQHLAARAPLDVAGGPR